MKEATRQLVLAAGGPAKVKILTGVSDGQISRWQGGAYPDLIPSWAVTLIEFHTQEPIWATMLASLTSHRLVAVADCADGGDDLNGDLVGDLVGVAQSSAEVTSSLGSALADRDVTPGEAKAALATIGRHEHRLTATKRRLSVVAARGA
ncbi:hypothetical protein [Kaistia adipata]|uniref:hypothetical protein n=1 Tax=Kaistia adipata TaxID=166954 RepID=UPI0004053C7A|nr:hypothetical protein [Kaistia adipata]